MKKEYNKFSLVLIIVMIIAIVFVVFSDFEYSGEMVVALITSVTSVFSLFGLFFAIMQLNEMKKQSEIQSTQVEQELKIIKLSKSLDKADEFRSILDDCSIFQSVVKTEKRFKELIESKKLSDFEHFRFSELKSNYPNEDDRKILMDINSLLNRNFNDVALIYQHSKLCNQGMYDEMLKFATYDWSIKALAENKYGIVDEDIEERKPELSSLIHEVVERMKSSTGDEQLEYLEQAKLLKNKTEKYIKLNEDEKAMSLIKIRVKSDIRDMLDELLNRLETWAMAFNIGLADESTVYQSIHQSYLETIKYFYPTICRYNDNDVHDQYYTNIRDLYIKWSIKNLEDKKKNEVSATENNKSKTKL